MVKILALKFEPKKSYDHISKFPLHNSTPHQPQIGIGKIKTKVPHVKWGTQNQLKSMKLRIPYCKYIESLTLKFWAEI